MRILLLCSPVKCARGGAALRDDSSRYYSSLNGQIRSPRAALGHSASAAPLLGLRAWAESARLARWLAAGSGAPRKTERREFWIQRAAARRTFSLSISQISRAQLRNAQLRDSSAQRGEKIFFKEKKYALFSQPPQTSWLTEFFQENLRDILTQKKQRESKNTKKLSQKKVFCYFKMHENHSRKRKNTENSSESRQKWTLIFELWKFLKFYLCVGYF